MDIRTIMQRAPVIPVLVIDDTDSAAELAQALFAGGLTTLEITLRTAQAFDAIKVIKEAVPSATVGAGTVNTLEQLEQCHKLGVDFMVSPGLHSGMAEAARNSGIPYLPGIATASEALTAVNLGLDSLKFFPAVAAGGVSMLKALGGPYDNLQFCPTGGINGDNFREFLNLENVTCVGGSWVAPRSLVEGGQWGDITALAASVFP